MTNVDAQTPDYREIIRTIKQQLNTHKTQLLFRSVFILLPALVGIAILFLAGAIANVAPNSASSGSTVSASTFIAEVFGLIAVLLFLINPFWILVVGHVFKVERIIWIDSFFNNVTLGKGESLSRARKLFWPSVKLSLNIFYKYYFIFFSGFILTAALIVYVTLSSGNISSSAIVWVAFIVMAALGFWWYVVITNIRLRYAWFLFIDHSGQADYTHKRLFKDLRALNEVQKSETFKKLIAVTLGLDATAAATDEVVGLAAEGIAHLGKAGGVAAFYVNSIGGETVAITNMYAKEISYYLFYRMALQALSGNPQDGDGTPQAN